MYEYGTLEGNHYGGYGNKAPQYNQFIVSELLPWLQYNYGVDLKRRSIAGFSLGGLSALDIAWNNASVFSKIGAFSASLWWRSRPFNEQNPDGDRIMIETLSNGKKRDGLKFWFQVGTRDEEDDRNNNGIIDAIDDTQDAINALLSIGYENTDINYEEIQDGEHNTKTWGAIMPAFLIWAIGK
jgi:predicted alpha/beta superfamily hydrolase